MDTEVPSTPNAPINDRSSFSVGDSVIYGMHGKCNLTGIEYRSVAGETIQFYKLEVQKSALSRSTRQEPAIWVPVNAAIERGMRAPLTSTQADEIFKLMATREYYFNAAEAWTSMQPKLEATIRAEGAIGMAKVLSYLFVLKKKQIVPTPEVSRLWESLNKLLMRELSEATGDSIRALEEKTTKLMRPKLFADH
jgi:RNA polymerase-interacting CarD/CdnL/TRCF family regulator